MTRSLTIPPNGHGSGNRRAGGRAASGPCAPFHHQQNGPSPSAAARANDARRRPLGATVENSGHGQQDAHRCRPPGRDQGRGAPRQPRRGIRLRVRQPQAASRQYLSSQGHPRRAVAPGGLRRLRRQPPRLPRLLGNPSRLLPDPGRRPAGADRGRGARDRRGRRPRRRADEPTASRERGGESRCRRGRDCRRAGWRSVAAKRRQPERAARNDERARPRETRAATPSSDVPRARGRIRRDARTAGNAAEAASAERRRASERERQRRRRPARAASRSSATTASNRSAPRMRSRSCPSAASGRAAPVQDPGSDQAPPGAARPGGQGRARQQGRGAHHLSLARRPLLAC